MPQAHRCGPQPPDAAKSSYADAYPQALRPVLHAALKTHSAAGNLCNRHPLHRMSAEDCLTNEQKLGEPGCKLQVTSGHHDLVRAMVHHREAIRQQSQFQDTSPSGHKWR